MGRGYVRDRPQRDSDAVSDGQVAAMMAKLEARVKQVAAAKLEWAPAVQGSMARKTTDGRYACCKVVVDGKASYELWRIVTGFPAHQLNKGLDNFLQAQTLAQIDADKRRA